MADDHANIHSYVAAALRQPADIRERQSQISTLMLVAVPVILLFSLFNFSHEHRLLAAIELCIGMALTPTMLLMRRRRIPRLGTGIFILGMLALFGALMFDGGIDNSAIYWVPVFPFVALLTLGLRPGSMVVLGFLGIAASILGLWHLDLLQLPYTFYQILTFMASFLTFTIIAFFIAAMNEFNTYRLQLAHNKLAASDEELRKAHADLESLVYERTHKLARAKKELEHEVRQKEEAIEQLRSTQEKFFQAQKMEAIGTLVGGIAHDFNNMLSGITANLYLVKMRIRDEQTSSRLEKVDTLIMHAADMIRQLMTFARKDTIQLKPFDFNAFIREAFKLACVSIAENIKTTLATPDEAMHIRGDATQLQQVLMNLMNNARDALDGRNEPEIHVTLRSFRPDETFRQHFPDQKAARYACLSVRDNGHGIPEEKLSQIFEPFFTTKSSGHGTGLGLAMIYGSVESHSGVIDVKSRVGHGTTFTIYLPLITDPQSMLNNALDDSIAHGKGETLLLVDDDAFLRQANADVLRSLNYQVIEAANGREAIRLFEEHVDAIDLVLLDVVMPEMGGVEAATRIRRIRNNIGIIFITGYDKDGTLNSDITGEGENIIMKPLTIEKLSSTIHRHFLKSLDKSIH